MSRDALYQSLLADQRLINLGFDASSILPNYDRDQRPNDEMFLVITYDTEQAVLRGDDWIYASARPVTIWVHMYREFSTDFVRIDNIIDILNDIARNLVQVPGADGRTLTMVEYGNASRDLRDDTYQTLCRSVTYRILSRETAPV